LERVFGEARTTIIIHSTFISAERVIALWPMFEEALKRGVRIHVFWGEADDKEGVIGSAKAIATLRELSDVSKWGDFIRFHPFSTGSHAKVLVGSRTMPMGYSLRSLDPAIGSPRRLLASTFRWLFATRQ
jgi:cardiolipin synthase A/B